MGPRGSIFLLLAVLGCDAQAPPSYRGELLAALRGSVTTELASPPSAQVLLLWANWGSAPERVVGDVVEVNGAFPAGFDIALYVPPPPEAMNDLRASRPMEPRLAIAWIVVLRGDAVPGQRVLAHDDVKGIDAGGVLGWAEDYVLAYVEDAVPEGTWTSAILGGARAPGYHLLRTSGKSDTELKQMAECLRTAAAPADACTRFTGPLEDVPMGARTVVQVKLTRDLERLRVPLFALPARVEQAFRGS